jgi:hypothetical protein
MPDVPAGQAAPAVTTDQAVATPAILVGQAALATPTGQAVNMPAGQAPSLVSTGWAPSLVPASHAAPLVHDCQAVTTPAGQAWPLRQPKSWLCLPPRD